MMVGISERQCYWIKALVEQQGAKEVVHGNRGRGSNCDESASYRARKAIGPIKDFARCEERRIKLYRPRNHDLRRHCVAC